jgi:hypothetical protein
MIADVTPNGVFYLPPTGWLTSFYNPPTKNGYGRYAIVDIESYTRFVNGMKLLKDLEEASEEKGLYTVDEVFGDLDK